MEFRKKINDIYIMIEAYEGWFWEIEKDMIWKMKWMNEFYLPKSVSESQASNKTTVF